MFKLIIFSSEFPPGPGGIGTHAYQLALNLVHMGWDITVLSPQDSASEEEVAAFTERQPFRIHRLPSGRGLPMEATHRSAALVGEIRKWHPDLLVATGGRSVWLAAAVSRVIGLPWVAVGHGSEFAATSRWERWLTRFSFGRSDCVVCVSEFTKNLLLETGTIPRELVVIPNGADALQFKVLNAGEMRAFKADHRLTDSRIILTVGHVSERKGQDLVIRALPHILRQIPEVLYLIAGLPTRQKELESLARNIGVEGNVRFLGRLGSSDLVRYINSCDVFVMTSRRTTDGDCEGFGIAVVEAALCGKPAVVSAGSGLAEAIVDGETGIVVPQGDHLSTAQAVTMLLSDEQTRKRMGAAAMERAVREQAWGGRVGEYDRLFHDILKERNPR